MTERVLLAVDFSNQLYRATATHTELTHDGTFTGGLYGLLVGVASAIHHTRATDLVICRDTKPYRRSLLYPDYKAGREATRDPEVHALYRASEPLALECFDLLGVPVWAVPGFESDDLVAHAVRRYGWRFKHVVAMSNDADLWQLFDHPNFRIYRNAKQGLQGPELLLTDYAGLTPAQYVLALALSGTHNEVPGLEGIGPKKSAAMVREPSAWRRAAVEHAALLARNTALIRLPHAELTQDGPVLLPTAARTGFPRRSWYRWAGRYDLNITPQMELAFEQVLT